MVWLTPGVMAEPQMSAFNISDVFYYRSYDGMGSERVYAIMEGQDRAVWMGTRAGVERYNGRKIKHYDLSDNLTPGDYAGRVIKLFAYENAESAHTSCMQAGVGAYDNAGRIYSYNPASDRFILTERLSDYLKGNIILNGVEQLSDGSMLVALSSGLYRLNSRHLYSLLPKVEINAMTVSGTDVYLATTSGVITLNISGKSKPRYMLRGINVQSLHCDTIAGVLYAGSFDAGLWRCHIKSAQSVQIAGAERVLRNPIRAICQLDAAHLAVGIDGGGVYICHTRDNTVRKLVDTDDSQRFYLNGNGVYALMRDRYGNLWTGSYTGGAAALLFRPSAVTTQVHESGNTQSIRHNNINSIAENSDGSIWYATDSGISIFNPLSGRWSHSSDNSVVVSLTRGVAGGMLAGTYGNGILILDAAGQVTRRLTRSQGGLTSNAIFCIRKSRAGEYWAATLDGGVMRLDASLRLIHTYPVDVAFSIAETPEGRIGVATANGFQIIDPASHKIRKFAASGQKGSDGISCYITSLLFNADGTVWCGSEGGGVFVYDTASQRVCRVYTIQQGLPSNDIYSIQRDSHGRMIVSTSNGLALYNGKGFKSLNYFRGLGKEYNKSASTLLANGDMIFGSVHGADRIIPSKITNASYEATINIRGVEVADLVARADQATGSGADGTTSHSADAVRFIPVADGGVRLGYADRSFTVNFEAINLPYQDDIAYQYILEGYDNVWSKLTRQGVAEYKNVPSGSYTLRVRSLRNSDGVVLDEVSIKVSVAYPWWNSWWAWCVYVVVFSGVAVMLYRAYLLRLQKEHDDDKIRFFINTAHDIRTPVSLVMAPITDLKHDTSLSDKARELVNIALANIAKLSNVTNQLLEFERFDSGRNKVEHKVIDISALLNIEAECFRDAFDRKEISLHTIGLDHRVYISADSYLLEMLFDNLLSNAFKYTNPHGEVRIKLSADQKRVHIIVQDNGIGIPGGERRRVMREVYRARNARESQATGTGFGLLQVRRIVAMLGGRIRMHSREGEGTSFVISFPRVHPSSADSQVQPTLRKKSTAFVDTAVSAVASSFVKPSAEQGDVSALQHNFDIEQGRTTLQEQAVHEHTVHEHTILVVEDNDDLRLYLHDMFSTRYDVVAVESADKALEYLEHHYPDLILSDVMMPGMQGDELCHKIKSNPSTAGIPVILLTAKADHDSVMEGLGKGADDYLAKPFNSDILRLKVSGMIANRDRMRQQLLTQAVTTQLPLGVASESDCAESDSQASDCAASGSHESDSSMETSTSKISTTVRVTTSDVVSAVESTASDNARTAGGGDTDREFVERATSIVLMHMSDVDFDIDMLCREMAVSRTLLFGRLKSLTGKAPQDFIRLLRMESAAELLRLGLSVNEVADRIGFANVKYFSTVFKKHFGTQPSRFVQLTDNQQ